MNPILLSIAAHFAVLKWMDGEERAVEEVQDRPIDAAVLNRWMRAWGLGLIGVNRLQLAAHLENRSPVIVEDLQQGQRNVPAIVAREVQTLIDRGIAAHPETSLMSKFVFSLRPDLGVPIDRYVRRGIRHRHPGPVTGNHGYAIYFGLFNRFLEECREAVQAAGLVQAFQPMLDAGFMTENMFTRRTADKYLWLLGKFPAETLREWGAGQP